MFDGGRIRAVLFGVTHNQKEPLLTFHKDVLQDCLSRAQKMLAEEKTQVDGASLLYEVIGSKIALNSFLHSPSFTSLMFDVKC